MSTGTFPAVLAWGELILGIPRSTDYEICN